MWARPSVQGSCPPNESFAADENSAGSAGRRSSETSLHLASEADEGHVATEEAITEEPPSSPSNSSPKKMGRRQPPKRKRDLRLHRLQRHGLLHRDVALRSVAFLRPRRPTRRLQELVLPLAPLQLVLPNRGEHQPSNMSKLDVINLRTLEDADAILCRSRRTRPRKRALPMTEGLLEHMLYSTEGLRRQIAVQHN